MSDTFYLSQDNPSIKGHKDKKIMTSSVDFLVSRVYYWVGGWSIVIM